MSLFRISEKEHKHLEKMSHKYWVSMSKYIRILINKDINGIPMMFTEVDNILSNLNKEKKYVKNKK